MLFRRCAALFSFAFALPIALVALAQNVAFAEAPAEDDTALEKDVERLHGEGKYDAAFAAAEKLVAIREAKLGKDDPKTASALSDLGAMWLEKGDPTKAEPLLVRAVGILEKTQGHDDLLANVLNNYAALLAKKSDFRGAEALFRRVIALEEKGGATRESALGSSLALLGSLLTSLQRYEEVEKLLQRAVSIHEKRGPELSLLRDLMFLGAYYRAIGQFQKAADQYNRAVPLSERAHGAEHPVTGSLYHHIGVFLTADNQKAKAEVAFQKAETILVKALGPDHPNLSGLYVDWAFSRTGLENPEKAIALFERAQDIDEKYLENALASGTELDQIQYAKQLQRGIDRAVSFQMDNNMGNREATRFVFRTVLRHKGRVLEATASGVGGLRSRMLPEDKKLYDEMVQIRGQLAASMVRGPRGRTVEEHIAETSRLSAQAEELEERISSRNSAFRTSRKPLTIEAIQERIPEDAALLEYVQYTPENRHYYNASSERSLAPLYMAYVLTHKGDPHWYQISVSAAELQRKADIIRKASQDPKHGDFKQQLGLLFSVAIGPLVDHLPGIRHLIISPDGVLSTLPLSAVVTYKNHFLIEDYSLSFLSSGRDLLRFGDDRPKSRSGPLVIANPDYDAPSADGQGPLLPIDKDAASVLSRLRFTPLPGTAEEANAIQKVLPDPRMRLQAAATETEIKAAQGPKIVHIATHGFFLDEAGTLAKGKTRGFELETNTQIPKQPQAHIKIGNPMFLSALALAGANVRKGQADDGILTAYEVSALDLTGTELVVLSACETGLGGLGVAREGVQGLRRALIVAGSETQVMSLWQVDDKATRDLMTSYYEKLFRQGKGRAAALQEAQLEMLAKKDREHPFYWASFIVSGDWRPLSGIVPTEVSGENGILKAGIKPSVPPGGGHGCGCQVVGFAPGNTGFLFFLGIGFFWSIRRSRFA